jgi:hypothetical protein
MEHRIFKGDKVLQLMKISYKDLIFKILRKQCVKLLIIKIVSKLLIKNKKGIKVKFKNLTNMKSSICQLKERELIWWIFIIIILNRWYIKIKSVLIIKNWKINLCMMKKLRIKWNKKIKIFLNLNEWKNIILKYQINIYTIDKK